MNFISDILLGFGAIAAAVYCFVLSRKLSKLKGLDQDLGSAIAILSRQVDEMTKVLSSAQDATNNSASELENKTEVAANVAERLELMIAALQDLPETELDADARLLEEANAERPDVNLFVRNASRRAS
ncbi:hypothetical protein BCF46_2967 [Litoreibacter meonggei]|uniref:Uncharacterized protein n=1 Tax=Litoreibacter meonggei TaxID=1049199 RepID=A0A497VT33_9RHOB|nr:hypothetical protein [Litoreibacter meonggei]RLJ41179.1 hypothetical protein BCF46_2967 [Litoreibacter meonggei]